MPQKKDLIDQEMMRELSERVKEERALLDKINEMLGVPLRSGANKKVQGVK